MKLNLSKMIIAMCAVLALFIYSCDSDEATLSKSKKEIHFQKISLKEIKNKTARSKSSSKVLQAVEEFKKQNSRNSRQSDMTDYYVDENSGTYIETEGTQTYTFPIYDLTTENLNLENLVVTITPDGITKLAVVKYALTAEDLETSLTPEQVTPVNITGKVMENSNICMVLYCSNDGHGSAGANHVAGQNCTNQNFLFYIYVYYNGTNGGVGGNNTGGIDTGNGTNTGGGIVTTPVGGSLSTKQISFLRNMSFYSEFTQLANTAIGPILNYINTATGPQVNAALYFFNNQANYMWLIEHSEQSQVAIFNFLIANNFSVASKNYVNSFITQSISNPELQLDFNASVKSPAFIDMSSVMGNSPEEVKFREVYDILCTSPQFKLMFLNLFGNSPLFNVKFQVANLTSPGENKVGECALYQSNSLNPYNVIEIDRQLLLTRSKIEIVQTIVHECIHAFLNIKLRNPNIGMSIDAINNLDFQSCINTYYNGFYGNQTQHSFFVNNLIPFFTQIFQDIKDQIVTPQQASMLENPTVGGAIIYQPLNNPPTLDISATQVS